MWRVYEPWTYPGCENEEENVLTPVELVNERLSRGDAGCTVQLQIAVSLEIVWKRTVNPELNNKKKMRKIFITKDESRNVIGYQGIAYLLKSTSFPDPEPHGSASYRTYGSPGSELD
jgi:hypothetical protein